MGPVAGTVPWGGGGSFLPGECVVSGFVNNTVHSTIHNNAIHKAAGRRSAGGWNDLQGSFQLPAPFTAYGSFRNCTRQNHGTAGNREASGFVNSAVKPPASWFPAVP